jgi:hypothetical protein
MRHRNNVVTGKHQRTPSSTAVPKNKAAPCDAKTVLCSPIVKKLLLKSLAAKATGWLTEVPFTLWIISIAKESLHAELLVPNVLHLVLFLHSSATTVITAGASILKESKSMEPMPVQVMPTQNVWDMPLQPSNLHNCQNTMIGMILV